MLRRIEDEGAPTTVAAPCGRAARAAMEHAGCRDAAGRRTSAAGEHPVSTISPFCITAMRSAKRRTMPRSWVMKRIDMPSPAGGRPGARGSAPGSSRRAPSSARRRSGCRDRSPAPSRSSPAGAGRRKAGAGRGRSAGPRGRGCARVPAARCARLRGRQLARGRHGW